MAAMQEMDMLTPEDLIGPRACDPGGKPILIVEPDRLDTENHIARDILAPWPDVLAGVFLETYLHCNYPTVAIHRFKGESPDQRLLSRCNIIIIGGPVSNSLARKLLDEEPTLQDRRFRFVYNRDENDGIHTIQDTATGTVYDSRAGADGKPCAAHAYGMVIKRPSPWNPNRYLIIAAGDYARGTQGAVAASRNPKVHALLANHGELESFDMLTRAYYPDAVNPRISGEYLFPEYLHSELLTFSNPDMTRLIPALTNIPISFEHAKSAGNLLVGASLGWLLTCAASGHSVFAALVAFAAASLISITSRLFKCIWIRSIAA